MYPCLCFFCPCADIRVVFRPCCAAYRLISCEPKPFWHRLRPAFLRVPESVPHLPTRSTTQIVTEIMDLDNVTPETPTSPNPHPLKRPRPSSPPHIKHSPTSASAGPTSPSADLHDGTGQGGSKSAHSSSSFRNVSACNRCRLRKNRCDQKLPSCASCEKARVACVGYDPITKREIPRRSVRLGHAMMTFQRC